MNIWIFKFYFNENFVPVNKYEYCDKKLKRKNKEQIRLRLRENSSKNATLVLVIWFNLIFIEAFIYHSFNTSL